MPAVFKSHFSLSPVTVIPEFPLHKGELHHDNNGENQDNQSVKVDFAILSSGADGERIAPVELKTDRIMTLSSCVIVGALKRHEPSTYPVRLKCCPVIFRMASGISLSTQPDQRSATCSFKVAPTFAGACQQHQKTNELQFTE